MGVVCVLLMTGDREAANPKLRRNCGDGILPFCSVVATEDPGSGAAEKVHAPEM